MKSSFIFFLILGVYFSLISCDLNSSNPKDGYTGDLIPIKEEVNKISDYQRLSKIILKNFDRIKYECDHPNDSTLREYWYYKNNDLPIIDSLRQNPSKPIKYSIIDSISGLYDSLNLRFRADLYYYLTVEDKGYNFDI